MTINLKSKNKELCEVDVLTHFQTPLLPVFQRRHCFGAMEGSGARPAAQAQLAALRAQLAKAQQRRDAALQKAEELEEATESRRGGRGAEYGGPGGNLWYFHS